MTDESPYEEGADEIMPEGAHPTLVLDTPNQTAVDRVWKAYWLPLLMGENDRVSMEKLKAELYDAWYLVNEARKVYRHVTNNMTDDLTASADGIIAMANHMVSQKLEPFLERIAALELELKVARGGETT